MATGESAGTADGDGQDVIRVVLADDNYMIRQALVGLLEAADGIAVVGACRDQASLMLSIDAEHPDVVVTDIRMPPTGTDEGLQVAASLRRTHPKVGVVVLSQY